MSIATGDLLMLVRLLEGRLEPAEGVQVRERLAVDKELLIAWRTLARVLEHDVSGGDLRAAELVPPEQMAAFVEGHLERREATDLEQTCWNHPTLLREVVSVFRAVHGDDSETRPNLAVTQRIGRRMDEIVSRKCSADVAMSRRGNNGASASPIAPRRSAAKQRTAKRSRQERSRPILTRRASPVAAQNGHRRLSAGLIAIAASVLLLLAGWFLFSRRSDSQQPAPGPVVEQRPATAPPAPKTTPNSPSRADDPSLIVKRPPNGDSSRSPDSGNDSLSPKRKNPPGSSSQSRLPVAGIDWNRITGIVAARRRDRDLWAGIRSLTGPASTAGDPLIVRTLAGSRIQGRGPRGTDLILDGNSEVRVGVNGTGGPLFDLEPRRGRIAVVNLNPGDQIRYRIGKRVWTVKSQAKKTSLGFTRRKRDSQTWELLAWNGRVMVDAVNLSAGRSLRWDGASFEKPMTLNRQSDWRRTPQPQPGLAVAQIDRCNRSDDLTTALLEATKRGDASQRTTSLRLGFALNPVTTVPAAAVSADSGQRTAAINWLLTASEASPVTRQVWSGVKTAVGSGGMRVHLRRWFEAMRNGRKPQTADLARLVHGLGPRQPVFVRQCAIHFLRQTTRLPLAEYNPERPTRAALKSVALKVRRATGNAHPRSRKGKRRRRSRKKKDVRRRAR